MLMGWIVDTRPDIPTITSQPGVFVTPAEERMRDSHTQRETQPTCATVADSRAHIEARRQAATTEL